MTHTIVIEGAVHSEIKLLDFMVFCGAQMEMLS